MDLCDIAILNIISYDYRCIGKNDVMDLMQNADLTKKG